MGKKETTRGILTSKEVNSMASIFSPQEGSKQPLIVLIEGESGMGKTTYCRRLAFDWASKQFREGDESFPIIDVLLLLRCREIKSTLWDAIEDQILPEEIEREEKMMFFQFLEENPSKVLLALDGLDEAEPQTLEMCLKLIQRKQLPGCYIVLTSRHEAGSIVRPYTDTLFEIGFTVTDAKGYIRKYFQHREHSAKELISKLIVDEDLRELTQNPLITLLLCVIFEDLKGVLPSNKTQLYLEIVLFILRRYESKNGVSNRGEDLLLVYKKELMILGETALDSLHKQELYFDDHKGYIKESMLMKFGFLSIQSCGGKRASCDRYRFFHKTFQEFFSGFFLAFSVIDGVTNFQSVVTVPRYMDELLQVFKFMSGIIAKQSKETAESIVHGIASIVNETGPITHKFISYLKFAHYFINECKTCSGDPCTRLVRTFGESLDLVDMVVNPFSQVCDSEVTQTFLQALAFNLTVSNLWLFNLKLCKVKNLLAKALKNTSLSSLYLSSNSIGDEGANSLAQALRVNNSLSSLVVSKNSVGDEGANSIAQSLRDNTSLSSLVLQSNFIGNEGADSLAQALRVNATISSLDLSRNSVGAKGANSLAQSLKENSSLSSLVLQSNFIGNEGADSLAQALRVNASISSLDLSRNSVGAKGANSLAQALKLNTSLSSLDLSYNLLGAEGAKSLSQALRVNTYLSSLNLYYNSVGNEGANSLAEALRVNTSLSSLDVSENSVGDEAADSLAQALMANKTLTSLILCRNSIGDEGANSLAQALRVNTFLSSLVLSRNFIGDKGANSVAQALSINTYLSSLDLSHNSVGNEGADSLAQSLRKNVALSSLDLSYNSVGADGGNSFAQALRENTSLSSLNLCENSIGDEEANSLDHDLRINAIRSLELRSSS